MKDKITVRKLTGYVLLPLAFFITGILFLYCTLNPFVELVLSTWDMFSSDFRSDDEEIYNDIFTETSLKGYEGVIPASSITYPTFGTKYGEINIHTNNTVYNCSLIFGESNAALRKGAAHFIGSHFPGESSTILVSAHNTTYFNCLKYVKPGEIIEVNTNYGYYKYEVISAEPHHKKDETAYDLTSDREYLVLYTCYPFDTVGFKVDRYFVTAILLSGPQVDQHN